MQQQKIHTKDKSGGYHVPDGYFENLTPTVVTKAQSSEVVAKSGATLRSFLGFAAGFAAMVLLAVVVTRTVTPSDDVPVVENAAVQTAQAALLEMYDVSEDDILEYYLYPEDTLSGSPQMAIAIGEYLETFPTESPIYDNEI